MRKNREIISLVSALILVSFILSFLIGVGLLTIFTYIVPAVLVIYAGKYFLNNQHIAKNPILGFPTSELWYVFFGSQILKMLITYVLEDFLHSLLIIGLVEWLVMALEVVSFGALIILLSKLTIKMIPR